LEKHAVFMETFSRFEEFTHHYVSKYIEDSFVREPNGIL